MNNHKMNITMKQIRLLIMMLLLCVGATTTWAAEVQYRVLYEQSILTGTGYTVKSTAPNTVKSGDDAHILIIEYTGNAPSITSATIGNYIEARQVANHNTSFYVNTAEAELGYAGNIYINYQTTAEEVWWTEGNFRYSNIYQRETYTRILMPEGQVAVSLNLNNTNETVTDTVCYALNDGKIYLKQKTTGSGYSQTTTYENQVTGGSYSNNGRTISFTGEDGYYVDGSKATYTYLTQSTSHGNGMGGGSYFFTRTHKVVNNRSTTLTIPATVTAPADKLGGGVKQVTAIQKWGFAYNQTHQMDIGTQITNWGQTSCDDDYFWGCIDDHSNRYLTTVRFAEGSNIKSIGDYAFMSCTKLNSIVFPKSLEYLGQGIFEMCQALKDCRFQLREDGKIGVEMLKMFTFWMCTSMESLELPEGITEIEGQSAGAALQYMLKLTNIKLPNTLEKIGPHFLCCAMSLQTLTIPANVKYIDGASFHGCQKLETVYLLGPASALQREYTGSGETQTSSTFSANATFCAGEVSNCTFYTTPDYINSYASDPVWGLIADNRSGGFLIDEKNQRIKNNQNQDVAISGTHNDDNNKLYVIPEEKRTFEAGKWVTAIFPGPMKHTFSGDTEATTGYAVFDDPSAGTDAKKKCRVAKMTGATTTTGTDPSTGKSIRIYSLTFTLVPAANFETGVPYMFCPGRTVENYVMIPMDSLISETFRKDMTNTHEYDVYSSNGPGQVIMKGQYSPYTMHPWDFYFSYQKPDGKTEDSEGAKFYRVPDAKNAATAGATRCYWTVYVDGVKEEAEAKPASQRFFDDTTGIDDIKTEIVIEGVYDLNGRKLDIKPQDLPKGLFIINGKKVMMK